MSLFLRIDINIVAMILLSSILFIAVKNLEKRDKLNRTFLIISTIILVELFFETMTCVINGQHGQWLIPVSVFMHVSLFAISPILTYFWYAFIKNWLDADTNKPAGKYYLLIPVFINFAITVLSPVYGSIFSINSENIYQRGPLFWLMSVITFFYMAYSMILILIHRKKLLKEEFLPLIVISIIPIAGGVLQTVFYGALLVWSSTAFCLVINFYFLQQRMIQIDKLTGAWTKDSLNHYITRNIKNNNMLKLGIVFLDLDGLKQINDQFGHLEGDFALKTSVELIKSTLRKTDIVSRFGGDEFIIVIHCESKLELESTINRTKTIFSDYNETSGKGYRLEFSFGADILNDNFNSLDQFILHADKLMYDNKKSKITPDTVIRA